ncbi:MAG: GNAT family N-acetyltransferase [Bacteroidetes bacterium]|nr:MAG: GNAT family N-acetyltransferase [Bacteroidota bacterium]
MNFTKTDNTNTINNLRSQLYQTLIAPIDAMWEQLYIGSSQHYLIEQDDSTIGYCCIDDNKSLVQIFLGEEYNSNMQQVISRLIESKLIASASLSSNEPIAFNACLSLSQSITTNTFCFEHTNTIRDVESTLQVDLVTTKDIPSIKAFLKEQVGMDDTFGYTENLVERKEIFMIQESNTLIATSECRMSNSQPEVADIGIIVHSDYQSKGIATQIMQLQVNRVLEAKRRPICSTTSDNKASRRMIEKSGFHCTNTIFDITF